MGTTTPPLDLAHAHEEAERRQRRWLTAGLAALLVACLSPGVLGSVLPESIRFVSVLSLALFAVSAALVGVAVTAMERRVRDCYESAVLQAEVSGPPDLVSELSGWKVSILSGATPTFTGLLGKEYGTSATMTCLAKPQHDVVDAACSCGFHAFYVQDRAVVEWHRVAESVLLLVEGYGRAIQHRHGWRAQKQEVVHVYLPPRCRWCRRPAAGLATAPRTDAWFPCCTSCGARWRREFWSIARLRNFWRTEVSVGSGPACSPLRAALGGMLARLRERRTVRSGQQ